MVPSVVIYICIYIYISVLFYYYLFYQLVARFKRHVQRSAMKPCTSKCLIDWSNGLFNFKNTLLWLESSLAVSHKFMSFNHQFKYHRIEILFWIKLIQHIFRLCEKEERLRSNLCPVYLSLVGQEQTLMFSCEQVLSASNASNSNCLLYCEHGQIRL